jgi:hypothetical protein
MVGKAGIPWNRTFKPCEKTRAVVDISPFEVALLNLCDRVKLTKDAYYLDNRPATIQQIIIAANMARRRRDLGPLPCKL